DHAEYERCVLAFADAIISAAGAHPGIPRLRNVQPFNQIPNAFAGGQWEEAADSGGWIPGAGVVNFVYAAAKAADLPISPGRYGETAASWRPYLPPEPRTIEDMAKAAAKKNSLRYREILINGQFANELAGTKQRKNLTVVIVDPQTLSLESYNPIN